MKKSIYVVQFGTGSNVNLLPLSAGQLVSRLKRETMLLEKYTLQEMVFRREDPARIVSRMEDVFVIGFSCSLWNMNISMQTACLVKQRWPEALVVTGGPSVPKDSELVVSFFQNHPYVDAICIEEGEEVFVSLCKCRDHGKGFSEIKGLIYKDEAGVIRRNPPADLIPMASLPSPFLDGTFDDFYEKYSSEFSGIIWETNRGCPYTCSFCTWGSCSSLIREKPMEQVRGEIEWIGRHRIRYIAMSDANFGIRRRDVELVEMLAECKRKYGVPHFISVSWVKNSSDKVLKMAGILKQAGIGFRVTLSLQSMNEDVLKAIHRSNMMKRSYDEIKQAYRQQRLYSYTELILGLPEETYETFFAGIEQLLSPSVFDQLYIYPLFLFPNTEMGSLQSRAKYGIESTLIVGGYTKSKGSLDINEYVEIVTGTKGMPHERYVDSFVEAYYTLGLHDNRLAFFILTFLRKTYGIKVTELVSFARAYARKQGLSTLRSSFALLEKCARDIKRNSASHLLVPEGFGGIPYDPPDGIFLTLLLKRRSFYPEFLAAVEGFLESKGISHDAGILEDLFRFQEAVVAHPDGPPRESLDIAYDWVRYFGFTFLFPEQGLLPLDRKLRVVDPHPSGGKPDRYLEHHYNIRGVPAFNRIVDESGKVVFPPLPLEFDGVVEDGEKRFQETPDLVL